MHSGRKIILTPYESEGQQNKVFLIVVDSLLVHARVIDFRQKRLPYNDCCNLHAATDTRAFYFTKYRLLHLHGFLLTGLFLQSLKKQRKQSTPCI